MQPRTPFVFGKTTEEKELQKAQAEAESAITVAGDRARKCLSTEDFKSYREAYRRAEVKLVDALLKYNNYFHKNTGGDITNYAMVVSRYLTKLESLRSLLEVITRDAHKGQTNAES